MSPVRKRRQPKVGARPLSQESLTKWQKTFRAQVAKIAPSMVRAETKAMLREADSQHAAHPGAISDSFHEQYKASMKELIELQQTCIAEGRVFREFFANIDLLALRDYLDTQTISPAWLVGFSNDKAVLQRYKQDVRKERAAALHPTQLAGAKANIVIAEAKALQAVRTWSKDPVRCNRLSRLSYADVVGEYLKQRVKPPRRQAAKLREMLKGGRIK
jgi:hypothetical protein